ncbi:Exosome complex protein [Lachnellula suecica]|uniref:Exosome complex protein n=1 Tax=Lachnellula suecica TaxID=602035 RepID=A0A8T9CA47_9HELO|nr:Exosome complex protein [Lachnellula suecica]
MDSTRVLDLLEQLDDEVDDLEQALAPLLETALAETSSKLPLLDKAKLYTMVTYAIESMLFSYLRLNGVQAREHPVFTELTRVKQYFGKIKATETPATRTMTIDKAVAKRFLEPGLAAAERDSLLAAELRAKEKARAHIKFDELNKQIAERKNAKKRSSDAVEGQSAPAAEDSSSDSDPDSSAESVKEASVPHKKKSRKRRKMGEISESVPTSGASSSAGKSKKKDTKKRKEKSPKQQEKEKKKAK